MGCGKIGEKIFRIIVRKHERKYFPISDEPGLTNKGSHLIMDGYLCVDFKQTHSIHICSHFEQKLEIIIINRNLLIG